MTGLFLWPASLVVKKLQPRAMTEDEDWAAAIGLSMDSRGCRAVREALQRAAVEKLSPPGSTDEFPVTDDDLAARENSFRVAMHLPAFVGTIVHVLMQGLGL